MRRVQEVRVVFISVSCLLLLSRSSAYRIQETSQSVEKDDRPYELLPKRTQGCPVGAQLDEEQCLAAAAALDFRFRRTKYVPFVPSGCYSVSGAVDFNSWPDGKAHFSAAPICLRACSRGEQALHPCACGTSSCKEGQFCDADGSACRSACDTYSCPDGYRQKASPESGASDTDGCCEVDTPAEVSDLVDEEIVSTTPQSHDEDRLDDLEAQTRNSGSVEQDMVEEDSEPGTTIPPWKLEWVHRGKLGNMVKLKDSLKARAWCEDKIGQMLKIVKVSKAISAHLYSAGYMYTLEGCRGQYKTEDIEEFTEAPTPEPTLPPTPTPTRGCEDDEEFVDEKGSKCEDWQWASQGCSKASEAYSYSEDGQASVLAHCPKICGMCTPAPTPSPTHEWRTHLKHYQREGRTVKLRDRVKSRAWCRDKIGKMVLITEVTRTGFGSRARFDKGFVYQLEGCKGLYTEKDVEFIDE